MSELVKELRDPSNSGAACKVLVLKAADEIERLQVKVALWDALIADTSAAPCQCPCLRDDLEDWKQFRRCTT